jgi:hypothetical protein
MLPLQLTSFGESAMLIIPIPVPVGASHVVTVEGSVWKLVDCSQCGERFAYLLELQATGENTDLFFVDGQSATTSALREAERKLFEKGRNVVAPVPCPRCGHYQAEMARRLKDEASINRLQIAGLSITLLAFAGLATGVAYAWVLTIIATIVGLAFLACGYVKSFRFDPNAGDPAPRIRFGRQRSVWGDKLTKLLATHATPNSESTSPSAS